MATQDTCCTIVPYFKIHEGKLDEFKKLVERFVASTEKEEKCLYYGFCFNGNIAHCREGYVDADALLVHLGNVKELVAEAFTISDRHRIEVHGPEQELAKLREPLAELNPEWYVLEYGFRR